MPERAKILLVDDDALQLAALVAVLEGHGYSLRVARTGEAAVRLAAVEQPDLVLLDVLLGPGMDGYETCAALRADPLTARCKVLFLSTLEDTDDRVRGLEAGGADFISKPIDAAELVARIQLHATLHRLQLELEERNAQLAHELEVAQALLQAASEQAEGPMSGQSKAIRSLREKLQARARDEDPVVLLCPTGAGAEAAARWLHARSDRRHRPFIGVGADQLHVLTQPTDRSARDWLELAREGVLFIQCVAHLDAAQLAAVAAVATAGGGARVVAAITPAALPEFEERFAAGALLVRPVVPVPPLNERLEDIPVLVGHFLERLEDQLGRPLAGITEESLRILQRHDWPGNIAELRNLVERAGLLSPDEPVDLDEDLLLRREPVGSYQLEEVIGVGGMGQVWRARHKLLARTAAVKLIGTRWIRRGRRKALRMFRDEAKATARLRSPHTVTLYDFGVTESGDVYYVMELLDGVDLARFVLRHGALPPARVVPLLRQACHSLAEAHRLDIVHRDLKPSNLIVGPRGLNYDHLTVLDFGVTRHVHDASGRRQRAGTPGYSAPEVLEGHAVQDARADVYSLGAVAFFLLTGRPLFHGVTGEERRRRQREGPAPRPSVYAGQTIPEELDLLIARCLEPDPLQRPVSVAEVDAILGALALAPWPEARLRAWWTEQGHPALAGDEELGPTELAAPA